jgi:transposase
VKRWHGRRLITENHCAVFQQCANAAAAYAPDICRPRYRFTGPREMSTHTPPWTGPPSRARDMGPLKKSLGVDFWSIKFLVRFDGRAHAVWCPKRLQATHCGQLFTSPAAAFRSTATAGLSDRRFAVLPNFEMRFRQGSSRGACECATGLTVSLPLDGRTGCPRTLLLISASCGVSRR